MSIRSHSAIVSGSCGEHRGLERRTTTRRTLERLDHFFRRNNFGPTTITSFDQTTCPFHLTITFSSMASSPCGRTTATNSGENGLCGCEKASHLDTGKSWCCVPTAGLSAVQILGIAGGQFDMDGVCGAVVSIRYQEDIISMWNSDARDREKNVRLRDTIKRVLSLPPSTILEYKAHNTAMKDNSSFRNTDRYQ
mmetsp:Transcript_50269/g.118049  ORF Transcript_50269/g.118049 Transcript_50269/m.118049 type:complete len:194 (-) Transcript_50269:30-611(-)